MRQFFILITLILLATPATGQHFTLLPPNTYAGAAIGSQAGDALGGFMGGVNRLQAARAEFNRKIEAARQDFFDRYPDGEGVEAAGARFSALLAEKEMAVLSMSITRRLKKRCSATPVPSG